MVNRPIRDKVRFASIREISVPHAELDFLHRAESGRPPLDSEQTNFGERRGARDMRAYRTRRDFAAVRLLRRFRKASTYCHIPECRASGRARSHLFARSRLRVRWTQASAGTSQIRSARFWAR